MANELRKAIRFLQGVACTVGLDRGDDPGIVRLAEELSAALNIKELDAMEDILCRQEIPFWDSVFVAAGGAGFRSVAQVYNTSTDCIIVVDDASASFVGAGASIGWARTQLAATTSVGALAARDGRFPRGLVFGTDIKTQNGVALPAGFTNGLSWEEDIAASTALRLPVKVVLPPGQGLSCFPGVDNIPIRANFAGRIWRVANPRELNP